MYFFFAFLNLILHLFNFINQKIYYILYLAN